MAPSCWNSAGTVVDWSMGNGTVQSGTVVGNTVGYSIVGTGDFNGDGTTDLLWHNSYTGVVSGELTNGGYISLGVEGDG